MEKINPVELASEFWEACSSIYPGAALTFPRRFDLWLLAALPVSVVHIPHLTPSAAATWASSAGLSLPPSADDRPVHGYLVAAGGMGLIFVDQNDSPDEVQFTLAHEAAHFICHYDKPRRRVLARLGADVLEVLDGTRPATAEERLAGVLRGCPIGQYQRLFDRTSKGEFLESQSERAEIDADLVAFELMVPAKEVRASCFRANGSATQDGLYDVLTRYYQLPPWAAGAYAAILFRRSLSGKETWLGGLARVIEEDSVK